MSYVQKTKDLWSSCKGQPLWIRLLLIFAIIMGLPLIWKTCEILLRALGLIGVGYFLLDLVRDDISDLVKEAEQAVDEATSTQPPVEEDQ